MPSVLRSLPFRFLGLALLAAGCVSNPYSATYRAEVSAKVPQGEPAPLPPSSQAPRLLSSSDMRADGIQMLEQGYRPIGSSRFTGEYVDARPALEQAAAVGADVVLVMQKHIGSNTVSVPIMEWAPDQQVVQHEVSQVHSSDSAKVQTFTHDSVTTVQGEYQTRWEPETVETYQHLATYWRKAPAPRLGALVSELGEAERQATQSNKGVLVRVVVRKSPAFLADILRGDIIQRIGGQDVLGVDGFFESVSGLRGKTVDLQVWRQGATLIKKAALGGD